MSALLSLRSVSVNFGRGEKALRVVDGVSFDIDVGGTLGLVGESGSGKSVTSLAVLRLIPERLGWSTRGRIEFEGQNLLDLPADKMPEIRGRDIAMIFQEPMSSLNPVMTIGSQISEALFLHGWPNRAKRHARVVEMLRLVGIPDPEGRLGAYPHQFSGGMRQRVMIAMALACSPKLLIADEATTALDVTIQAQVLELMKKIRSDTGTAILMISHDLGVIADICDRVVVMYSGRVVEVADIRSLLQRPAHPYTRGLLESVPRKGQERERLYQVPGSVPMAGSVRQGCPFRARCSVAVDKCAVKMPPMFRFAEDQRAACWVSAEQSNAPVIEDLK
ncbi:ABC transporter ATP-binding protein [Frigidibacter sp. ROC022]|uniref:ABC transporter ATP-binding protein n=1 Tax=Frigidibacter sp. ROC022 TaxID=2971796 RepID=UPI00215B4A8C|nr:ABC transporter ATP-binding protein [Frigidibacter sp. ROC022]MCR8724608.1 ABC transporter ATP-binding protein [Frigidibacter sp. ROC022]